MADSDNDGVEDRQDCFDFCAANRIE
jgi:hypothetical protein